MSTDPLIMTKHIFRKENQLADVRRELDGLIFRKTGGSKRTLEKSTQTVESPRNSLERATQRSSNPTNLRRHSPERNRVREKEAKYVARYRELSGSRRDGEVKSSSISKDDRKPIGDRAKIQIPSNSKDSKRSECSRNAEADSSRKRSRSKSTRESERDTDKRCRREDRNKLRDNRKEPDLREVVLKKQASETLQNKTRESSMKVSDETKNCSVPAEAATVKSVDSVTNAITSKVEVADHEKPATIEAADVRREIKDFQVKSNVAIPKKAEPSKDDSEANHNVPEDKTAKVDTKDNNVEAAHPQSSPCEIPPTVDPQENLSAPGKESSSDSLPPSLRINDEVSHSITKSSPAKLQMPDGESKSPNPQETNRLKSPEKQSIIDSVADPLSTETQIIAEDPNIAQPEAEPSPLPSPNKSLETNSASKENLLNQSQLSEKSNKKRASYSKDINDEGVVVITVSRATKKKKKQKV